MKLINQSVEYIPQEEGLEGIYKQIEIAARVCYKSENRSTGDSKSFVDKLIKMKHFSMLEHGTIYLKLPVDYSNKSYIDCDTKYTDNPYSKLVYEDGVAHITTNYRVLVENNWLDDLKYLCKPTELHPKRLTFKLTTSISLVRELIRHRAFSFANESTRYIDYRKKGELIFIKPTWYNEKLPAHKEAFSALGEVTETYYNGLRMIGEPAQFAREVLPLCTKSELVMTGFEDDWSNFLDIRLRGTTGKPHPDMVELAKLIENEIKKEK